MLETIVDKVMECWVHSGRLQAMTPDQVETAIHQTAAGVRARARGEMFLPDGPPIPSLATCPGRRNPSLVAPPVFTKDFVTEPQFASPRKVKGGGRPKKEVEERILFGPGTVRDKARRARVSIATISRLMTVKRRMEELKKEGQ